MAITFTHRPQDGWHCVRQARHCQVAVFLAPCSEVSLHNLQLARELFPRLVGMRDGRVVFDGTPDELSDDDFHQLYDLDDDEMLQDGTKGEP